VQKQITPPIEITFATHDANKVKVLQINVPRGDDVPYAVDENQIYVRNESETVQAVRDEIVNIIRRQTKVETAQKPQKHGKPGKAQPPVEPPQPIGRSEPLEPVPQSSAAVPQIGPPKVGVEIVDSTTSDGIVYHTVRDLRNGSVVRNVTRKSARKLWHYAITQYEQHPAEKADIRWLDDLGLLGTSKRAGAQRYDFAQRLPDGKLRAYYGVTEDGIHGEWQKVAELAPADLPDGPAEALVDAAGLTENQTPA
jgi:hypothetical protein